MRILMSLLINALAVFVASYILPGIQIDNYLTILIVAVILGVINTFIRPILIILTLPINIVTLGLFIFVINGALVLLTSAVVPGFEVANIGWAILFSLVVALVSSFLNKLNKS